MTDPHRGDAHPFDIIPRGTQRGRLIGRGMRRQCPRCGEGDLFRGLFDLRDPCPRCGLVFEREEGYFLGAMIVSFALIEGVFALVLVATMIATWPDVPWNGVLVVALIVTLVLPYLASPWTRTVWMALDRAFMPPPDRPEPPVRGPGATAGADEGGPTRPPAARRDRRPR